jgi:hypothetical protein
MFIVKELYKRKQVEIREGEIGRVELHTCGRVA